MRWILYSIILGFAGGITFRLFFNFGFAFIVLLAIIAGVLVFANIRVRSNVFLWGVILITTFGIGVARVSIAEMRTAPQLDDYVAEEVVLLGTVVREPDERINHTKLVVETQYVSAGTTLAQAEDSVLLIADRFPQFHYGDRVRVKGALVRPDNDFGENEPGTPFDYVGYLAKDGIHYQMFRPEIERIGQAGNPVYAVLFSFKEHILSAVSRALPEPHAALAGGITFGAKRALGESLLDMFRTTGLIHIVVLSGYNISIVVYALRSALGRMPFALSTVLSVCAIIAFVIMTGANATAIRAGTMAVLALAVQILGRPYAVLNALFLAGGAMLAWNPFILLHDPSFQLSFMATFGLIVFTPYTVRLFRWLPERIGLREIAAATIAAQLFVLPLILYMTGTLSLVAPVANLVVLPFVPFAMAFVGVAAAAGFISHTLAFLFGALAYLPLALILGANEFFASLPFASVTIASFPLWAVFGIYAWLLGGLFVFQRSD